MFLHRMIVAEQHKGRSATTSFDRFGEQLELFHVVASRGVKVTTKEKEPLAAGHISYEVVLVAAGCIT